MNDTAPLDRARQLALDYLASVDNRPVGSRADFTQLVHALGDLHEHPQHPTEIVETMAQALDAGLVATAGPRYFGFVIGGSLPAALAADWLTSAWDQNAFSFIMSPAAAATEEIVRRWLVDILGLQPSMSLGIVTGATMANFTCLAAARTAQLRKAGWDVEEQGLFGAPDLRVITSAESHATVFASLQMLGLGRSRVTKVATDDQGRMRADALREALREHSGPLVVCAQAGNVNTGAFDPFEEIAGLVHDAGGWLHIDGAFGAWAAATASRRHLVTGMSLADSVAIDAHKWLNVPYDCGLAFTQDDISHRVAMSLDAPYYVPGPTEARSNGSYTPESSRRARAFTVYAAMRELGRSGVSSLVDRCCDLAVRIARALDGHPGVRILNDVVLNQVLVRFETDGRSGDELTADVIRRVQADGTCWLGGTTWRGMHVMRVSVSSWKTMESDIDVSARAILSCLDAAVNSPRAFQAQA